MNNLEPPSSSLKFNFLRKSEQYIYFFNMSEDVWPFIQMISDPAAKKAEIEENANLSDRELFSIAKINNPIFIGPKPIQADFLNYFLDLVKIKNLQIFTPQKHSGELCSDCLDDPVLFKKLVEIGKSVKRLILVPYSSTFQFYELIDALKKEGITIYTPESPDEEDAWTVNFFGSKSGIRQLSQIGAAEEPDLLISDGLICVGIIDAARIAANKYLKEDGVVIKTNKGHSGAGVLIFRENDLPHTYKECEEAIYEILKKDSYWNAFPIIIESLVNVNPFIGGGFPNVEFRIKRNGEINFLYSCGIRVTKDGVFHGVEINKDVINDRINTRLIDTGYYVGEQLSAAGYRGSYDLDFIAGRNNQIYVTESNVRRTGGTFSYEATSLLIGKNFMIDAYTLTNTAYQLSFSRPITFIALFERLKSILYNHQNKEGVVIASANLLAQNKLAYIIFGKNKKRALFIEDTLHQLLRHE